MLPKHLEQLSMGLANSGRSIRHLNLSYNILDYDFDSPNKEHSDKFLIHIHEFFEICKFINHVNFSGMNF